MSNDTRDDHGKGNALAGYDNIREMVAALECDYERLEELRDAWGPSYVKQKAEKGYVYAYTCECGHVEYGNALLPTERCPVCPGLAFGLRKKSVVQLDVGPDETKELTALESAAGECKSRDDAEQRIHEDALEVTVRSGWYLPGDKDASAPHEFCILLTTGGPALRMRGELDEHSEPCRAWLEYQDWGTPWTRLVCDSEGETVDSDVLLDYARCFYFGEG